jgi:hypothetical protein
MVCPAITETSTEARSGKSTLHPAAISVTQSAMNPGHVAWSQFPSGWAQRN